MNIRGAILGFTLCLLGQTSVGYAATTEQIWFEVKPQSAKTILAKYPGKTVLLVTSNADFGVYVSNMIGEISVDIQMQGQINGITFGHAAQHPGQNQRTAFVHSPLGAEIYHSIRKTAAKPGTLTEQAELMTFTYDHSATPVFEIIY